MSCCSVTVDDFKAQFARNFPIPSFLGLEQSIFFEGYCFITSLIFINFVDNNSATLMIQKVKAARFGCDNYVSDNDMREG